MAGDISMEEEPLRQGRGGSQFHTGSWECRFGRFTPVQLRLSAQGDIEIDSKTPLLLYPWYCLPFVCSPPSQIRGVDAVGASAEGTTLSVWYTSPPPTKTGSRGKRRKRKLVLALRDEQECADAVRAIRGQAVYDKEIQPLLKAAGIQTRAASTRSKGHATELVKDLRPDQADAIAVVGGDGTVFEVLQGLLDRPNWDAARRLPLVQIPAGSGNGLAASTGLWDVTTAVHALVKGHVSPMDVSSVLQPPARRVFSFLSLTYGMIPNLDIGTDHLRWMGSSRFVLGAVHQIMKQGAYPARVAFVDARRAEKLGPPSELAATTDVGAGMGPPMHHIGAFQSLPAGCNNIASLDLPAPWQNLLSGEVQFFAACNIPWLDTNFHVAPGTLPHDGHLTLLYTLGKMGRVKGLRFMAAMDSGQHMDRLSCEKPIAFVLEPQATDTWIVVDGEEVAHSLTFMEVHPSLCRVIVCPRDPEPGDDEEARVGSSQATGVTSKAHHQR